MLYRGPFIWYILLDANEPNQYYWGRSIEHNGIRDLGIDVARPAKL